MIDNYCADDKELVINDIQNLSIFAREGPFFLYMGP